MLVVIVVSAVVHAGDIPRTINYQGYMKEDDTAFTGVGVFKFAITDSAGTTSYWTNDGQQPGLPVDGVEVTVTAGVFSVLLGDASLTNMTAIDIGVFSDNAETFLRVWCSTNDGTTYEEITPKKKIGSSAYAYNAYEANTLVSGSTINSVTISQLAGAMDCDSQAMTDANIDSGTIDNTVIGGTTPLAATVTTLKATTGIELEDPDAGTNTVALQASTSLSSDYSLTLPINNGDADQFLQTDGNGVLSWDAAGDVTTDTDLTAVGVDALKNDDGSNDNTAVGAYSLDANTLGTNNTAIGQNALGANISASNNTAVGAGALFLNTAGNNTAIGREALYTNDAGYNNTATGYYALRLNTDGDFNTAYGYTALDSNTGGNNNTAIGKEALGANTTSSDNTACGFEALLLNTGANNTGVGQRAGDGNTSGTYNTLVGNEADVGSSGLTNATAIGNGASVDASHKVRVGNGSVTVIEGQVAWTNPSDIRIKKNIIDNDLGLEFIQGLRPVSFEMKEGHEGIVYDGFIAQEVEDVMDELGVTFSGLNKPDNPDNMYSLGYSTFVVPLVNAVKELNNKVQEQQEIIEQMEERLSRLEQ